jgi:hypothetical protein
VCIEEDAAPWDWSKLRRILPRGLVTLAERGGQQWYNQYATQWRASPRAVSREHWLAIEKWQSPKWVEVPYGWNV